MRSHHETSDDQSGQVEAEQGPRHVLPSAHRGEHCRESRTCVLPDAGIAARLAQHRKLLQHAIHGVGIRQQQRLEAACLHLQRIGAGAMKMLTVELRLANRRCAATKLSDGQLTRSARQDTTVRSVHQ